VREDPNGAGAPFGSSTVHAHPFQFALTIGGPADKSVSRTQSALARRRRHPKVTVGS